MPRLKFSTEEKLNALPCEHELSVLTDYDGNDAELGLWCCWCGGIEAEKKVPVPSGGSGG